MLTFGPGAKLILPSPLKALIISYFLQGATMQTMRSPSFNRNPFVIPTMTLFTFSPNDHPGR